MIKHCGINSKRYYSQNVVSGHKIGVIFWFGFTFSLYEKSTMGKEP